MTILTITSYVVAPPNTPLTHIPAIPLPGHRKKPKRFLGWYGGRRQTGNLKKVHLAARSQGKVCYRVDIEINIGDHDYTKVWRADLPEIKCLDIGRLTLELEEHLLTHLHRPGEPRSLKEILAKSPWRVDDFWQYRALAHLHVIAWDDPLPEGGIQRVAALRSPRVIDRVLVRNYNGPTPHIAI